MTMRLVVPLLLIACVSAYGQTSVNPDISVIGDFRVFSHNDTVRADEADDLNLAAPELELNASGYLNPYVRADVVVGWHEGHNAAIEELFATVERGLPLNANLRIGKYLLEFGRLNPVHPHAYSFIKRPLPHEALFGEEGLADVAVRGGFLLPTGEAYTEIMAGLLKGDALSGHTHEAEESEHEEGSNRDPGFFGRLTTSLAVSESAELALGGSALNAVHQVHEHDATGGTPEQLRAWLLGGDLKYKYRPDRYTSVQTEAEGIVRIARQDESPDDLTSLGAYGYIDYRFRQQYNLGGILEWTRIKTHDIPRADTWRFGLFAGWAPVEETSLVRFAGHWTELEDGTGFWEATLQMVFSLGPHKPHNF